jgi:capsular polysaccharide transport system ATP-binding protein
MISLRDVTKNYPSSTGNRLVLDRVNMVVRRGERVGILGRNGSGKSTLIKIIGGASRPSSGIVTTSMRVSWPLAFGGAFQGSLTGLDNLRFICRIYRTDYRRAKDVVEDFSGLSGYLQEPVKTYSSGMRARFAFAVSLAVDFDCLLIDEVVAVGDSRFHERCRRELFDHRSNRATILVTHDENTLREYCNRAAVLDKGVLSEFGDIPGALEVYRDACKT